MYLTSGLTASDNQKKVAPLERIDVFLRHNRIRSIRSTALSRCPSGVEAFGGICDGEFITGGSDGIFIYDKNQDNWVKISGLDSIRDSTSSYCMIGNNKMLLTGGSFAYGNLHASQRSGICAPAAEVIELHTQYSRNSNNLDLNKSHLVSRICYTRLPVPLINHSVTQVAKHKIIVVGGIIHGNGNATNRVFAGEFSIDDAQSIQWKELEPLEIPRYGHLSFRLGSFLYVAGGVGRNEKLISSCEVYNINENKWQYGNNHLPYPLSRSSVVTDSQEKFALICGGEAYFKGWASSNVIIFTKEDGFYVFDDFSLQSRRYGHIAGRIE